MLQDDEKCIKKLPLSKVFRYNKGKVSMWFNFFVTIPHRTAFSVIIWGKIP